VVLGYDCVDARVDPDVSKDSSAFMFRVKQSTSLTPWPWRWRHYETASDPRRLDSSLNICADTKDSERTRLEEERIKMATGNDNTHMTNQWRSLRYTRASVSQTI
jgi:hypothetical protein